MPGSNTKKRPKKKLILSRKLKGGAAITDIWPFTYFKSSTKDLNNAANKFKVIKSEIQTKINELNVLFNKVMPSIEECQSSISSAQIVNNSIVENVGERPPATPRIDNFPPAGANALAPAVAPPGAVMGQIKPENELGQGIAQTYEDDEPQGGGNSFMYDKKKKKRTRKK